MKRKENDEDAELRKKKEAEFAKLYPSELKQLQGVYSFLRINYSRCNSCRSRRVGLYRNNRFLKCRSCGAERWLTKDTFFEDMKHPKLALTALWFADQNIVLSAAQAARISGAAYSSAAMLFKKLDLLKDELANSHLGEAVPSYELLDVVTKRSRETPARNNPKSEEWEISGTAVNAQLSTLVARRPPDRASQGSERDTQTARREAESGSVGALHLPGTATVARPLELGQDDNAILEFLSDVPSSFDSIVFRSGRATGVVVSSLMMLELAGHALSVPGNRYVRVRSLVDADAAQVSDEMRTYIATVLDAFRSVFDGVSRKYLQLYVSRYWFIASKSKALKRRFWLALRTRRSPSFADVRAYVTSQTMHICYPQG